MINILINYPQLTPMNQEVVLYLKPGDISCHLHQTHGQYDIRTRSFEQDDNHLSRGKIHTTEFMPNDEL